MSKDGKVRETVEKMYLGVPTTIKYEDTMRPDNAPDRMLQFFSYLHLPPDLQKVSKPFCDLAHQLCLDVPMNPERTVALRKLLEAKDCAVRAVLYKG